MTTDFRHYSDTMLDEKITAYKRLVVLYTEQLHAATAERRRRPAFKPGDKVRSTCRSMQHLRGVVIHRPVNLDAVTKDGRPLVYWLDSTEYRLRTSYAENLELVPVGE